MFGCPALRVAPLNDAPARPERDYILYWMTAARRTSYSFGLDHAIAVALCQRRPLIVLEPLRVGYPWASDRIHRFILDGMADQRARFAASPIAYHPYVEPTPGAGSGLLVALAARAARVVTDRWPCFFFPRMQAAAAARLDVRLEAVDSCGLLPLAATDQPYATAQAFRRVLQRELPAHLRAPPTPDPLLGLDLPRARIPEDVLARWPAASDALLDGDAAALAGLPIDHEVGPTGLRGGERAARAALRDFVDGALARYGADRDQPDSGGSSGLSPWLHFGQLSPHEVFESVAEREAWFPARISPKVTGRREGWWGMSEGAERYLDELVTWRELSYTFCFHRPDHDRYDSLPDWARAELAARAADPRPHRATLAELDAAATHDPIWNAAQRQLRGEGRIHNYLRMLWGKKVLEWSDTPEQAWDALIELNNRYALDGRDPNSYSGISWVFGRFDRPWGPRRPIFGTIRYMSSESTARKLDLERYLERWSGPAAPELSPADDG